MSRSRCPHCFRLTSLCLCHEILRVDNRVEVLFLQHPMEKHHVKNTARLAFLSLQQAQWLEGEVFDQEALPALLSGTSNYLLYPATPEDQVSLLSTTRLRETQALKDIRLIVLDGTWRKTRKMLFLNPLLAALPRLQVTMPTASHYDIRQQKNQQSYSTLEAVQQALGDLEQNAPKYAPMQSAFDALLRQQKAWMTNGDGR